MFNDNDIVLTEALYQVYKCAKNTKIRNDIMPLGYCSMSLGDKVQMNLMHLTNLEDIRLSFSNLNSCKALNLNPKFAEAEDAFKHRDEWITPHNSKTILSFKENIGSILGDFKKMDGIKKFSSDYDVTEKRALKILHEENWIGCFLNTRGKLEELTCYFKEEIIPYADNYLLEKEKVLPKSPDFKFK